MLCLGRQAVAARRALGRRSASDEPASAPLAADRIVRASTRSARLCCAGSDFADCCCSCRVTLPDGGEGCASSGLVLPHWNGPHRVQPIRRDGRFTRSRSGDCTMKAVIATAQHMAATQNGPGVKRNRAGPSGTSDAARI